MDAAEQLYGLPPEDFTTARNELATRLRKEGDRAGSDAVKRLAKPSVTAWALNQVARREAPLVASLLAAGDNLRQAQHALLAGGPQADFREASQAERERIAELVRAAAAVLAGAGHPASKATLDRLEATARAASTDPVAGQLLSAGHLTADLDPAGFGGFDASPFGPPTTPLRFPTERRRAQTPASQRSPDHSVAPRGESRVAAGRQPAREGQAERLVEARDRLRGLQHDLQGLRKAAAEAETDAARARQAATKADRAWAEARKAAAQAEKAAAQARRVEEDAVEELARLRADIDRAAQALETAQAAVREPRAP